MNTNTGKEIFSNSINQVKGVAILLVVLGHIDSPLGVAIFSFHIPLFFFLGGLFIKSSYSLADFLKKNFIRLIIPYFIFGLLGFFITWLKNILLHRPQGDLVPSITDLLIWMDAPHLQHYGLVLWFLPALFWARVLSFCFIKYLKLDIFSIFIICLVCTYVFTSQTGFILPFALDKGIAAMLWVFMGSIFNGNKEKFLSLSLWKVVPVTLPVLLAAYFEHIPHIDMATKNIDNIFISVPYTFSVIILLIYSMYYLNAGEYALVKKASEVLLTFGSQSMLVYIVHPYTNNMAFLFSSLLFGEGYWYIKFAITAATLWVMLKVKSKYKNSMSFKYL